MIEVLTTDMLRIKVLSRSEISTRYSGQGTGGIHEITIQTAHFFLA